MCSTSIHIILVRPQKMIDTFRSVLMAFLARLCQHSPRNKMREEITGNYLVVFRVLFHRSYFLAHGQQIDKTSVLFSYSRFKVCFLWCCKKAEIAKQRNDGECFKMLYYSLVLASEL